MVERMARAMATDTFTRSGNDAEDLDEYLRIVAPIYLPHARAALTAMREPTPEMIAAALPVREINVDRAMVLLTERSLGLLEGERFPAKAHAQGVEAAQQLIADWQAMIDAALHGERQKVDA